MSLVLERGGGCGRNSRPGGMPRLVWTDRYSHYQVRGRFETQLCSVQAEVRGEGAESGGVWSHSALPLAQCHEGFLSSGPAPSLRWAGERGSLQNQAETEAGGLGVE